jgi:hypothetical protein
MAYFSRKDGFFSCLKVFNEAAMFVRRFIILPILPGLAR